MEEVGELRELDLSGTWRATPSDEPRRRSANEADLDLTDWSEVTVPGHWATSPLAGTSGPVLYRRAFEAPTDVATDGSGPRRRWLVLDGVFSTADVWLDGTYVLDLDGWFFPHEVEVTDLLGERSEHVLTLEVACPMPEPGETRRDLLGTYGTLPPSAYGAEPTGDHRPGPGGIWRGVRIAESGPVRIRHWRGWCSAADETEARVSVRLVLDAAEAGEVTLRTTVGPVTDVRRQPLAAGENRVELTVAVPEPDLWWPWSLGDQPMHELAVSVLDASGEISDRRQRRIGLRRAAMHDWVLSINGERIMAKGARQGPARALPATADDALAAGDVALALEAGLDLVRLEAHVGLPAFYDAADDAGLLIWQDLPLQGSYHRSVRARALRQAREAVDLLAHHPSVAVWCAHDDPDGTGAAAPAGGAHLPTRAAASPLRRSLATSVPGWNRSVLDRALARAIAQCDDSRPIVASSGVLPRPTGMDGTDSHLGHGWRHGGVDDLATTIAGWPRLGRFVGWFGSQSLPADVDLDLGSTGLDLEAAWPQVDWERLGRHLGLDAASATRLLPPSAYGSFADWRAALERYQARLVQRQVEALRRISYRPTGGFTLAGFADAGPMAGFSVLDHQRRPKAAYLALARACAPLSVTAAPVPPSVAQGERLDLDVYVVAAAGLDPGDAVVEATLTFHPVDATGAGAGTGTQAPDGAEVLGSRRWEGRRPVDACARIGAMSFQAPATDGVLLLDLALLPSDDDRSATNRYEIAVADR